jgi:hypothetical protein
LTTWAGPLGAVSDVLSPGVVAGVEPVSSPPVASGTVTSGTVVPASALAGVSVEVESSSPPEQAATTSAAAIITPTVDRLRVAPFNVPPMDRICASSH